jgi:hypothetical protein
VHIDWHTSGSLQNGSGSARAAYYGGVAGSPEVYFDGVDEVTGAGDSVNSYNTYAPILASHLAAPSFSKAILAAQLDVNGDSLSGTVIVDLEVAPGESIGNPGNVTVRAVLAENDIGGPFFCCEPVTGRNDWDHISRAMLFEVPLSASAAGETQQVVQSFAIDPLWNASKLECVAWIQRDGNFVVLQAAKATPRYAIEVAELDAPVATVTGPDAAYDVEVTYGGTTPDDVRLTLDSSSLPAGWSAELDWDGAVDPTQIVIPGMTSAQVETVTVVVHTTGATGLGSVTLTTEPVSNTWLGHRQDYHTFLNVPRLLFIDDDNGAAYEADFLSAIAGAGRFAVVQENGAGEAFLSMFDAVVWNTADLATQTVGAGAQASLGSYLDGGGRLFLSSQGYLNHQGVTAFTSDYLGVDAFTADGLAASATGVASDPIGDGLSFALSPPFADAADHLTPGTAVPWLLAPGGEPIGVRNDAGFHRTVFLAAPFEGIPAGDRPVVMGRILDWLAGSAPTGIAADPSATRAAALRLDPAVPNPFRGATLVRFTLPEPAEVSVEVFDVGGRRVTELLRGRRSAGSHAVTWDGRGPDGVPVAAGVYLLRVRTPDAVRTRDVVRLR